MKILNNKCWFLLLLLSVNVFFCPVLTRSEDEIDDGEEDEAVINEEGDNIVNDSTAPETDAEDDTGEVSHSSPFVKTRVLFTQPEATDLPAGKLAKLLVGFHNNGTSNFIVDGIDGSFRYPQDFSYYIQNFSTFEFNKVVEGEREATFDYYFTPSETFSSRQFGLTINLRYRSADGKTAFVNVVFNDTINVIEPDEGLDGETFFLYIFLAALTVLLLFGAYHFLGVFKKKGRGSKAAHTSQSQKLSNGAFSNPNDVDLQWIPKEHLQTTKVSPRKRKPRDNGTVSSSGNSSNDEQ